MLDVSGSGVSVSCTAYYSEDFLVEVSLDGRLETLPHDFLSVCLRASIFLISFR